MLHIQRNGLLPAACLWIRRRPCRGECRGNPQYSFVRLRESVGLRITPVFAFLERPRSLKPCVRAARASIRDSRNDGWTDRRMCEFTERQFDDKRRGPGYHLVAVTTPARRAKPGAEHEESKRSSPKLILLFHPSILPSFLPSILWLLGLLPYSHTSP
jgi:hypothetical protein